jgi:ribonuclease HI
VFADGATLETPSIAGTAGYAIQLLAGVNDLGS